MKKSVAGYLFVLFVLFCMKPAGAQIVCTDVVPDSVVTGNATMDIDLNNDATPDFRITSAQSGILSFVVVQGSQIGVNNFVLSNGTGDAQALTLNTPIDANSSTWTQMNSTNQIMTTVVSGSGTGPWTGAVDLYLGLRLVVGINTYYGWARFSFSSTSNTYTFKDYAYNSVPGQVILAGQGCASLASPTFTLPAGICAGNSVTVTANTGTSGAQQYVWAGSPGAVITASNSSVTAITFSAAGPYTIALVVSSGTIIGVAINTLQVNAPPLFTVSAVSTTICAGANTTLQAGGNATSYSWAPSQSLSSATGSLVVASPTATQIYTVTAELNVCIATAGMTLNVESGTMFSAAANTNSICLYPHNGSANSVSVTATAFPVPNNYSVTLLSPPGFTSTNTGSMSIVLSTGPPFQITPGMATTTLQFNNGICTAFFPFTFSVVANPSIAVNNFTPVLCSGNSYTYTTSGADNYTWNGSTPNFTTFNNGSVAVANPSATTVFTIYGSSGGCNSLSQTSTLTVFELPVITVSNATACVNLPATLSAAGADNYNWTGPQGFSAATATVNVPGMTSAGAYVFTVTGATANSCSASATATLTVSVCVISGLHRQAENSVGIYPNPVQSLLMIQPGQTLKGVIEIIDSQGKIVLKTPVHLSGDEVSTYNVGSLTSGIYVLRISGEAGSVQSIRFVKE